MDAFLEQLILLKSFVIIAAIGTLGITIFFLIACKSFSWNGKNIRLIGFFYEASMAESVTLATCALKLFLVLSLLFTKGRIATIHICFFGVLVLVYNICRHNIKDMGVSLFNGVVIMGVLYVSNFLISYLNEVLFDPKIAVALVFLAVFLVLYSLYDIACCILAIVNSRKAIEDRLLNDKRMTDKDGVNA